MKLVRYMVAATGFMIMILSLTIGNVDSADAASSKPGMELTEVRELEAQSTSSQDWFEYSGKLETTGQVEVKAKVSGVITEAAFTEGSYINEGDILFRIDDSSYKEKVNKAKVKLSEAQTLLAKASASYKRAGSLAQNQLISEQALNDLEVRMKEAFAGLAIAKAEVVLAELELSYTIVKAPISGHLGAATAAVGTVVNIEDELSVLAIISSTPTYVHFDVDSTAARQLLRAVNKEDSISPTVQLLYGEHILSGDVRFVDTQINNSTRTLKLRAEFTGEYPTDHIGDSVTLRLSIPSENSEISIARAAIGTIQDISYVLTFKTDNKFTYTEVELGPVEGKNQIVTNGRRDGYRVLAYANELTRRVADDGFPKLSTDYAAISVGRYVARQWGR